MAFGILATNGQNETVIDGEHTIYGTKRSQTLTGSASNSVYKFEIPSAFRPTGTEILFLKPPVSHWVSGLLGDRVLYSSANTLEATIADQTENLSFSGGYGAAVYAQDGTILWHSNTLSTLISGGFNLATSSFPMGTLATLSGNSVAITGGGVRIWEDQFRVDLVAGVRSANAEITLTNKSYLNDPTPAGWYRDFPQHLSVATALIS